MSAVRNYAVVTASYWSFTLTDGALRMLVLLHFYALGYTPFMLAFLFLLYEAAGIFRQSWRRLARHALRHPAHADDRSQPTDRRARHAVRVAAAVEWGVVGRLCGCGPGNCRRRQGPDEDSLEIGDQGDIRKAEPANSSAGSPGSPVRRTP